MLGKVLLYKQGTISPLLSNNMNPNLLIARIIHRLFAMYCANLVPEGALYMGIPAHYIRSQKLDPLVGLMA